MARILKFPRRRPAKVQFKPKLVLHGDTYAALVNAAAAQNVTPGQVVSQLVEENLRLSEH